MLVISVSDEGEFGLIRRIVARLETGAAEAADWAGTVLLGPGDDSAVVAASDGRVVATTDLMVEGRHFRRDWSSAYDVGRKAAAANLADVVAMGARPTSILVGLATPADLPAVWADGLADGLRDECALVGASVVGGDVVRSDQLMIAVTALGDLEGRPPLTRAGARPGDAIVLLGSPGRAAAGLAQLEAGQLGGSLVAAHRRPQPPYSDALALARSGQAKAMIDLSDGLLADLGHVAVASGVGCVLVAADLPVAAELAAAAAELGVDALDWVIGGGDDHCFLATVADDQRSVSSLGDGVQVGTVVAVRPGELPSVSFRDRDRPPVGGHEHFRS